MTANRQYGYLNALTELAEDMEREAAKLLACSSEIRTTIVHLTNES